MFPFLTGALADEAGEVVENVTEAVTDAAEQVAETVQQAASEAPSWLHDAISKFGKTPMEAWITLGTLVVIGLVLMAVSKSSKKWTAKTIAFGALSVALSFVLSCIRLFRMPNGGSVTPASMLPIMLFAAANGVGPGFLTGIVYGILQCLQGGGIMAAGGFAQFALDYLLAFTVLGLAGFAKKLPKGWGLYLAIAIAALARMLCHTLAGVLFWDTAPWASFVYNISYLGPDTLICMVLALAIAKPVIKIMKAQ